MKEVSTEEEIRLAGRVRELTATYREAEDLINIGAYARGSNARIDEAIEKIDAINTFFRQGIVERSDHAESVRELARIVGEGSQGDEEVQVSPGAAAQG